jgi:hypothetical protein
MEEEKTFDIEFERMAIKTLLIIMFGLLMMVFIAPMIIFLSILGRLGNEEIFDYKDGIGLVLSFIAVISGGLMIKSLSSSIQSSTIKAK